MRDDIPHPRRVSIRIGIFIRRRAVHIAKKNAGEHHLAGTVQATGKKEKEEEKERGREGEGGTQDRILKSILAPRNKEVHLKLTLGRFLSQIKQRRTLLSKTRDEMENPILKSRSSTFQKGPWDLGEK